jgi:hypothetical protein
MVNVSPNPDNSPPRPDELPALAQDVSYEITMFWHMARVAIPSSTGPENDAFKVAMLIHARCLMDFFNVKPVLDDVVASHFTLWDPVEDGGDELAWLNENLVVLINKRVAHLTAYRQRVPKESHLVETVQQYVLNLVERFMGKVSPEMRLLLRGFPAESSAGDSGRV